MNPKSRIYYPKDRNSGEKNIELHKTFLVRGGVYVGLKPLQSPLKLEGLLLKIRGRILTHVREIMKKKFYGCGGYKILIFSKIQS